MMTQQRAIALAETLTATAMGMLLETGSVPHAAVIAAGDTTTRALGLGPFHTRAEIEAAYTRAADFARRDQADIVFLVLTGRMVEGGSVPPGTRAVYVATKGRPGSPSVFMVTPFILLDGKPVFLPPENLSHEKGELDFPLMPNWW